MMQIISFVLILTFAGCLTVAYGCGIAREDGTSATPTKCCDVPVIAHGILLDPPILKAASNVPNAVRIFTCKSGFQLKGSNSIRCSKCGHWIVAGYCEPDQPDKSEKPPTPNCGEPGSTENGYVQPTGTNKPGEVRQVVCNEGYSTCNSRSQIVCTENGWTPLPKCVKLTNRSEFFLLLESTTWFEGQVKCKEQGARLAHIKNQIDQERAYELLGNSLPSRCPYGTGYWIGGRSVHESQPWQWDDGSNMNFTYWSANEPSRGGCFAKADDMCLQMYPHGFWDDIPCNDRTVYGSICERLTPTC